MICGYCRVAMKLVKYKRSVDKFAWICMEKECHNYKLYISIRKDSFFSGFNVKLMDILRIIISYGTRQPRFSIKRGLDIGKRTVDKIIEKLVGLIPTVNFENCKLGGSGKLVQIDETMLNYKIKSHRGRSPSNLTDSLCIVEVNGHITRAFSCVIPDKSEKTLIPIICSQVVSYSKIWTDEHKSYSNLSAYNFLHDSVCHKYEFITDKGVNTQGVESFHNELKLEIKRRKGVDTEKRSEFLREFCFYFNNRKVFLQKVIDLIKI